MHSMCNPRRFRHCEASAHLWADDKAISGRGWRIGVMRLPRFARNDRVPSRRGGGVEMAIRPPVGEAAPRPYTGRANDAPRRGGTRVLPAAPPQRLWRVGDWGGHGFRPYIPRGHVILSEAKNLDLVRRDS